MIDYFEAIGRLVSYDELRNEFLSKIPVQPKNKTEMSKSDKRAMWKLDTRPRLDFRVDDYEDGQYLAVQNFFADVLGEGFLSFLSAGELLWTYNRLATADETVKGLYRTVVGFAEQATRELPGPSTAYFIALGAMIADKRFLEKLDDESGDPEALLAEKFLRRLSGREQDKVRALAANDEFRCPATKFYDSFWDEACGPGLFRMSPPREYDEQDSEMAEPDPLADQKTESLPA
jgi:hypothetical protein